MLLFSACNNNKTSTLLLKDNRAIAPIDSNDEPNYTLPDFPDSPALGILPIGETVSAKCNEVKLLATLGFNDPLSSCQWNLYNRGQTIATLNSARSYFLSKGKSGADINLAEYAFNKYSGKDVAIHIVDDSFEKDHEDISANYDLKNSKDCLSFAKDPIDSPSDNHGVMVSGIIAAVGKNGKGTVGVAYESSISAYNAFSCRNFTFALNHKEIDVWSGSYGRPGCEAHFTIDPVKEEIVRSATDNNNILYIKAAGNGRVSQRFCPGGFDDTNRDSDNVIPHMIAIAALDNQGEVTNYSAMSAALFLAAPAGFGYPSESPGICTTDRNNRYTCSMNGTSAAAPTVAGIAGLIKEVNPDFSPIDILYILAKTARELKEEKWTTKNVTKKINIRDRFYQNFSLNSAGYQHSFNSGFGLPDTDAAIKMAESYSPSISKLEKYDEVYPTENISSANQRKELAPFSCSTHQVFLKKDFSTILARVFVKVNTPSEELPLAKDLVIYLKMPDGTSSQLSRDSNISGPGYGLRQAFKTFAPFGINSNGDWSVEVCNNGPHNGYFKQAKVELWGTEDLDIIESK
jgi:hypothetical protein